MRTVGVDLATTSRKTAVAILDWQADGARVGSIDQPADLDTVIARVGGADKVGIDCPLGWPEAFVEFLQQHQHGRQDNLAAEGDTDEWRRSLAQRHTDREVQKALRLSPLSVSTDRIGLTAMHAAQLEARLRAAGHEIDRRGDGLIVEVYPAAGLKRWGLPHNGYKGTQNARRRHELVNGLTAAAPWLLLGEHENQCRDNDDALDAVLCAILSRAAATGKVTKPPCELRETARREGWIALPTCDLGNLKP